MATESWWGTGSNVTSLATLLPDGAGLVWCSEGCRASWFRIALPEEVSQDLVFVQEDRFGCQACFWCGQLVWEAPFCILHGEDGCPQFNFSATSTALELVHLLTKPGFIVSIPWPFIQLAEALWLGDRALTPRRLAGMTAREWNRWRHQQEEGGH